MLHIYLGWIVLLVIKPLGIFEIDTADLQELMLDQMLNVDMFVLCTCLKYVRLPLTSDVDLCYNHHNSMHLVVR